MPAPRPDRPYMPGYGISRSEDGMLPWSWAEERLRNAHNYWVATVHPDGRPNVSAVWGLWLDGAFWFSCSPTSRKAKNIARDPRCTITTELAEEAVILEGTAAPVSGRERLQPFVEEYKRKYDWDMDAASEGYFIVRPRRVFGFVEHADRFTSTPTRWTFD